MCKCFSFNQVISQLRSKDINRPIDLDSIKYFPQSMNSRGDIDYPKALKLALIEKLKQRRLEEGKL